MGVALTERRRKANGRHLSLDQIRALIESDLVETDESIRHALVSSSSNISSLASGAAGIGGKRLRPMLVHLSARVLPCEFSDRTKRDLSSLAAAVELVHAASLVHDDVMDAADERRHQTTLFKQLGNSAAILLGDFLFTRAYSMAAKCTSPVGARMLADAATKLCEGEVEQQLHSHDWNLSIAAYRRSLEQKTGALCAVSCELGAWRAGASMAIRRHLSKFGNYLGLAFQVFDDWLDYWGSDLVGKTLGTDLQQRKPTLPLIRGLQNPRIRSELLEILSQPHQQQHVEAVRALLEQSDARQYTARIARKCTDNAIAAITKVPVSDARDSLVALAEFSVQRAA